MTKLTGNDQVDNRERKTTGSHPKWLPREAVVHVGEVTVGCRLIVAVQVGAHHAAPRGAPRVLCGDQRNELVQAVGA